MRRERERERMKDAVRHKRVRARERTRDILLTVIRWWFFEKLDENFSTTCIRSRIIAYNYWYWKSRLCMYERYQFPMLWSEIWMNNEGENEIYRKKGCWKWKRECAWEGERERDWMSKDRKDSRISWMIRTPWSDRAVRKSAWPVVAVWEETLRMLLFPVCGCLLLLVH